MTRLMWLTPKRNILYATSAYGVAPYDTPGYTFEHLACFLPGLFALGSMTLPLDDLSSLGIDFNSLARDLSPEGQAEYKLISNYKLSDLHKWAAEGMTEACAMLYEDMPTGLSADSVAMTSDSVRWIDALEEWRIAGAKGKPPGVTPVTPVHPPTPTPNEYGYINTGTGSTAMLMREYITSNPSYELRPEVRLSTLFNLT
jgi:hypothetical protein